MGLRGPAKKPTALEEFEGRPGKRTPNPGEPKPTIVNSDIEPPEWMLERARGYWFRYSRMLTKIRVLTNADLQLLERYCDLLVQFYELRDYLEKKEPFTTEHTENEMKSFSLLMMRKIRFSEHLMKIEVQFGMTPSARTRVHTGEIFPDADPSGGSDPDDDDDPFAVQ